MKKKIAIIGAGMSGCCIAAALAEKSHELTIFEAEPQVIMGASRYNEGKMHLGYTYAMDKTLDTARIMAKSALMFKPLLLRWFGKEVLNVPRSRPFHYAIHKQSLLSADEFKKLADDITAIITGEMTDSNSYFGVDPNKKVVRLSQNDLQKWYDPKTVTAAFSTPEVSVDPEVMGDIIAKALPRIAGVTIRYNSEVTSIDQNRSGYTLNFRNNKNELSSESFDYVINASWRDRLRLDTYVGLEVPSSALFRLKYFVRISEKIFPLPTTTIAVGGFGDIVQYNDDTYLSWYPTGRVDWYEGIKPKKIKPILSDLNQATQLKNNMIAGLSKVVPALRSFPEVSFQVKGNWIYAPGKTDVNTKGSLLHKRTNIGATKKGNYFSINTGKYTCAPYLAYTFVQMFENEK